MDNLLIATRVAGHGGCLEAWLSHHLQFTKNACVLVYHDPSKAPDGALEILAKFPDVKYIVTPWVGGMFSTERSRRFLQEFCDQEFPNVEVYMHLDSDEFIAHPWKIPGLVRDIASGIADFAEGRMLDRFGAGLCAYDYQPTLDLFRAVAPVQAQFNRALKIPDLKCYMTRRCILAHDAERASGYRRHPEGMFLEHYAWTHDCQENMVVKMPQHAHIKNWSAHRRWQGWLVATRAPELVAIATRSFRPASEILPGWFDYADLYRKIVNAARPGETVVELGVWMGKSLAYLGEYAALKGKQLNIVGYDQFDPSYYLGVHKDVEIKTSDGWLSHVQHKILACAAWNTPRVVRCDSTQAAGLHADSSCAGVFIDACHSMQGCLADIKAWWPKVRSGGVLCGHDLIPTYPGVRKALDVSGIPYSPTSNSSWIANKP